MQNYVIMAVLFMTVFLLVASLYRRKKELEKFNNEWKFNFELINKITDLAKENRREMRELVKNAEIQQSEKVNQIEENYDNLISGCNTLVERLLQVYQENVHEKFKNLEVEIKREISDKQT